MNDINRYEKNCQSSLRSLLDVIVSQVIYRQCCAPNMSQQTVTVHMERTFLSLIFMRKDATEGPWEALFGNGSKPENKERHWGQRKLKF